MSEAIAHRARRLSRRTGADVNKIFDHLCVAHSYVELEACYELTENEKLDKARNGRELSCLLGRPTPKRRAF